MRVKELLFDVWLGFGVLGMAIGMLAPFIFAFYILRGRIVTGKQIGRAHV